MNYDDEYEDLDDQRHPNTPRKKSQKRRPLKRCRNPIVSAIQEALDSHGLNISVTSDSRRSSSWDAFIDKHFGKELEAKLGKMLITALLERDDKFPKVLQRAIGQIDPVFHRNLEKAIADKAKKFIWSLPEPLPPMGQLKIAVERNCNNGKPLPPYRWQRLCLECLIPSKRGRPRKKSNTEPV
jgi:hypothetical protein